MTDRSAPNCAAGLGTDFADGFEVRPGEIFALFGPPRSGKTALLHAMVGPRPSSNVLMIDAGGRIVPRNRFGALTTAITGSARGKQRKSSSDAANDRRWERTLTRALGKAPGTLVIDLPPSAGLPGPSAFSAKLSARLPGFAGGIVLATDDTAVVFELADRIGVVEDGILAQTGTPAEVAGRPRTKYAARLAGVNFFTGLGRGGRLSIGHSSISAPTTKKGRVLITLPPTAVTVHAHEPADPGPDVFEARIAHLAAPDDVRSSRPDDVLNLGLSPVDPEHGLELTAAVPRLTPSPWTLGQRVFARVDTAQLSAYDF